MIAARKAGLSESPEVLYEERLVSCRAKRQQSSIWKQGAIAFRWPHVEPAICRTLIGLIASLMLPKTSLFSKINSLFQILGNFGKSIDDRSLFRVGRSWNYPKSEKFPVFSLMIREFDVESGSHRTAPSATQSAILAFSAVSSKIVRMLEHFLRPEGTGEAYIWPSVADLCSILSV